MKKIVLWVILILLIFFAFSGCSTYNKMIEKREATKAQWQQVEVAYQRRADLIPNLVNTVKGVADFERGTLNDVIEARSKATQVNIDPNNLTPEAIERFEQAQGALTSSLSRLLAVVENYPQLRATENFTVLMSQLEGTENRISTERNRFNEMARDYNTYIQKFPKNLWAGIFNFEQYGYFESAAGTEVAPTVDFGNQEEK